MKLNGWQRMWVVFCILYTVLIVGWSVAGWNSYQPKAWDVEEARKELALEKKTKALRSAFRTGEAGEIDKQPLTNFYPTQAELEKRKSWHDGKEELHREMAELDRKEIKVVAPIAWLVGCVGLYLAGWTVGWIIRGFRKPKKVEE